MTGKDMTGKTKNKTEQVEEKLKSAADDLREAAEQAPDHGGDLHMQASMVERMAETAKVTLEDDRPVGRSGQGVERPDHAHDSESTGKDDQSGKTARKP